MSGSARGIYGILSKTVHKEVTFDEDVTFNKDVTISGSFTFGDAATDDLIVAGDLRVNDDRNLHFGTDEDVSITYDEAVSNVLKITGAAWQWGVDDTGIDVTMYGATSGAYFRWDESADSLLLVGGAKLNAQGTVTVGVDDTGYDVQFFGATASAYMLWDESEDQLVLAGAADLKLSNAGATTETANTLVPIVFTAATEVIAGGTGGAISVATYCSHVSADAGGDAFTMAAGTVVGQRKRIYFLATAGGTGVVTAAFRGASNTLTFTNPGEYAEFIWDGTDWLDIELGSTNDTNIATPPVLSTV